MSVRCVVDGVVHHFRYMLKDITEGHKAGGETFQEAKDIRQGFT